MAHREDEAARLRAELVAQLEYLLEEVEALEAVVDVVPAGVLEARPLPDQPTIKELFGVLVRADEDVYLPQLERVVAEDAPLFALPDAAVLATREPWNEQPVTALLARLHRARTALIAFLRALPPGEWQRTAVFAGGIRDVYGLAHHITQHDAEVLRAVGHRLYESRPARPSQRPAGGT